MSSRTERHVLILTEDDEVRRIFCESFAYEAVACEAVASAAEAISRIQDRDYAILALDLTSTSAGATQLINFLQRRTRAHRPLIFVLVDDFDALPEQLDPKVVTMVIAKPFDSEDIHSIIRQTLISLASVAGDDTLRDLEEVPAAQFEPPPVMEAEPGAETQPWVLVVDDDQTVQNLIVAALKREGVGLDTANDGAQAIEKILRRQYCAVILDLMMPKMSGWDVIDWFKKNPDKTPYSVIVSTAADRAVLHELDPQIVNAIFVKPFNPLELASYVSACSRLSRRDRRQKRVIGAKPEIQR